MKTALTTLLTILTLVSTAQKFSTINILTEKIPGTFATVYLDERPIGTLKENENLEYKIYSEGRFTLKVSTSSELIEVNNGQTIYYKLKRWDLGTKLKIESIDKSEWENLISNGKTVHVEEDINNPVGKLPDGLESDGPKQGTCFLISTQGYLLTNYHVISGSKKIQIKGIGNDFTTLYAANLVAIDIDLDLALLKIKNQNLLFDTIPYELSVETNRQGTKSFVLGFPLTSAMGEEIKVTEGIISAKSGYKGTISQYQFSAAVQPGNSGSPLFNENGDVIGVINAKLHGAEATGYAIKSQYVATFLNLIENVQLETNATTTANLALSDKIALLKNNIFIVVTD